MAMQQAQDLQQQSLAEQTETILMEAVQRALMDNDFQPEDEWRSRVLSLGPDALAPIMKRVTDFALSRVRQLRPTLGPRPAAACLLIQVYWEGGLTADGMPPELDRLMHEANDVRPDRLIRHPVTGRLVDRERPDQDLDDILADENNEEMRHIRQLLEAHQPDSEYAAETETVLQEACAGGPAWQPGRYGGRLAKSDCLARPRSRGSHPGTGDGLRPEQAEAAGA